MHWYAVWTRSRHEQVVRQQLEQHHLEAFLPTITRWSRWKDRKKKIEWPLFPSYCFARFDSAERVRVLKCSGVVNIVSIGDKITPIPDSELEGIRTLVESDFQYDPCPLIRQGMMVEASHGPLRGVIGRLVRKGSHARLVLSVDLIGQAVSVEVDAADVKPYSHRIIDEDRISFTRPRVRACAHGRNDGHGFSAPREVEWRLWSCGDGDG